MKLLVNHPRKVIATIVLLCSSTIVIPYFIGSLPQFAHPELVSFIFHNLMGISLYLLLIMFS